MCEADFAMELNKHLSEKEDLFTQLDEQDRIMKMMQRQLEKYRKEKDDYTQLVFQLQRQGKFIEQGEELGNHSFSFGTYYENRKMLLIYVNYSFSEE